MQSPINRDELMNSILSRSVSDPEFRQALLKDARGTIFQTFGVQVPESFKLRFIEKPPELDSLIVLPQPAPPAGELSDEDLESVAGGTTEDAWAPPPPPPPTEP